MQDSAVFERMDDLLLGLVRSELDVHLLQYPRALSTVIVL